MVYGMGWRTARAAHRVIGAHEETAGAAVVVGNVLAGLGGYSLGAPPFAGPVVLDLAVGAWLAAPLLEDLARHGRRGVTRARRIHSSGREHVGHLRRLETWAARRKHVADTWAARQRDMDRVTRQAWAALARAPEAKIPAGTRVASVTMAPAGRVLRIESTSGGHLFGPLRKLEGEIGAWFHAPATVEQLAHPGTVNVRLRERDPFASLPAKIVWPHAGEIPPHSALDPLPLAVNDRGLPITVRLEPGRHHRLAGTTGGGKGNVGWIESLWVASADDGAVYLIDHEGGVDYQALAPACVAYGTEALPVLERFYTDMMARVPLLLETGAARVTISPATPMMHLFIDGYQHLDSKGWALLVLIASKCRKYGGRITASTPVPLQSANRPEMKYLSERRIVLPLPDREAFKAAAGREPRDGELLPGGKMSPGRAVLVGFGDGVDGQAKVYWVGDGESPRDPCRRLARDLPRKNFPADVTPATAPAELTGQPETPSSPPRTEVARVTSQPVNEVWREVLEVVASLCAEQGGWVSQADIVKRSGRARGTVRAHLAGLEQAGAVEREQRGRDPWFRPAS